MAKITRGKLKGTEVKLNQWCNDWFTVELSSGEVKVVSPLSLQLTYEEVDQVLSNSNNGFMFDEYDITLDRKFKQKKG